MKSKAGRKYAEKMATYYQERKVAEEEDLPFDLTRPGLPSIFRGPPLHDHVTTWRAKIELGYDAQYVGTCGPDAERSFDVFKNSLL